MYLNYEGSAHPSDEWTDLVDRGGLIHVSDTVFMLFLSMEMEIRSVLNTKKASETTGIKDEAIQKMYENKDVSFYWCTIAANWVDEEADALLRMMIEQWVTIRGFSYVSSFMEQYKKEHMKSVQKSKGLRKKINSTSTKTEKSQSGDS